MKSPNTKDNSKMPKIKKSPKMTLDKLALIIQGEFINIYERLNQIEERICVLERKMNELKFDMADLKSNFSPRIIRLEQKVGI